MTVQSSDASGPPDVSSTAYLKLGDITVRFPGVLALDHVPLDIHRDEVHGLTGENGTGESTLLKVSSGVSQPETGTLSPDGVPQQFTNTRAAIAAGIVIICQELHLAPEPTATENLMLGALPNRFGVLDEKTLIARALRELGRLDERLDSAQPVRHLSIGQHQTIEIGKVLMRGAHVIAFDEPTSSLSSHETTQLFRIIRALKAGSRAVIYVTHRMEEVYELCDRVTVLRDGQHIGTFNADAHLDRGRLIRCMVGRSIRDVYGYKPRPLGGVKVGVHGLMGPGLNEPASFRAHAGEIVGFFGLVGAGRSELMKLLYGAVEPTAGEIRLNGKRVQFNTPRDAVRAGVVLCPEDRKQDGIVAIALVSDNPNISCRCHFSRFSVLNNRQGAWTTRSFIDKPAIRTRNGETPIGKLSDGNQQKAILSRWLADDIDVFLMDEPTRGIDVGVRSEIYSLLYGLAEAGRTVIVVSSDLAEVIGVADRVLIIKQGRIVGDLPGEHASPDTLIKLTLPRQHTHYALMETNLMQTPSTESVLGGPPMAASGIPSRAALTWELINRSGIVVVFVLLFNALVFTVPGFISSRNIQGLLLSVTLIGSISVTMVFVLALGEVNLSVASIVAFAGVMASTLITVTHSVVLGVGAGILADGLARLVNSVLVTRYQINSLIVTLATMEVVHGLAFITSNGDAAMISEERFFGLGGGLFLGISYPIWSNTVGFALFGFLLKKTVLGKNVLAVGGNEGAALLAGLSMMRIKIAAFVLQGLMTGFTDVMLASRMSLGDPKTSVRPELGVVSACVLGGVLLTDGVATMSGVLVGVLIMGSVQNAMSLMNVSTFYQYLTRGGILLPAVWFDRIHRNKRVS